MRTERIDTPEGLGLMVLLTPEIIAQLKPLQWEGADFRDTEEGVPFKGLAPWDDPVLVCKFFHCVTQQRLYITHGGFDPEKNDWRLFGFQNEPKPDSNWGHVYLRWVEEFRCGHGLPFERDRFWEPIPASQVTRNS